MRFVNHDESGTSSRLLTSIDSPRATTPKVSESGRKNRLSAPSQIVGLGSTAGAHDTCRGSFGVGSEWQRTETDCRSVSRQSGARRGSDAAAWRTQHP